MSYLPTFRDFGNAFGLSPNASIPEIDLAWLKYCEYCFDRVDQIRGDPDLPVPIQQLNQLLAESVIEDHLGDGWLEENVVRPNTRQAAGYIDYDTTRVQRLLGLYRVQELARRLFQLQSFDWFPRMVAKLRTENLSGVGFELDVLWLLHLASVNIQARSEVGARGSDYDLSAIILDRRIPVEAKAKDDLTPFTAGTVTQTLKRAAQQMPKGQQGVIFLRIPYRWVSRELEDQYAESVAEGVRQTSRVGAVITAIDKPHFTDQRHGNVTRHFHYFRHDDCAESIWTFALQLKHAWEAGWTHMAPPSPF